MDDLGGTRKATEPYSPKMNLFAEMDPLALMEALELGTTRNAVSTAGVTPPSKELGMRRCRLKWDGPRRCTMMEELPEGGEAFVLRAEKVNGQFYISDSFTEGRQNDGKSVDIQEKAGAVVQPGTKDTPFRLRSRGCDYCDERLRCEGCGADDRAEAEVEKPVQSRWLPGWLQGSCAGDWMPRQQLLEAHHRNHKLNSGATAHVMEVHVPHPRPNTPTGEGVVWCPCQPRDSKKRDHAVLVTKLPTWNPKLRTMVLDFAGRVKKASARNFQLCHKGQEKMGKKAEVVLQYGKVKLGEYALDYQYPLSAVQAMSIALSVTLWK